MKIKAILLSLLCFVGITTATAQSDVWVWKGGSAVKTEMADSITFTAPVRVLALATTEDIGKIVGADGIFYDTKEDAEAAGTTAVAMIAYVGNETDNVFYKHGLAIALADESSSSWSTAKSTCDDKYFSLRVARASWMLPSQNQWKVMFKANGGNEDSYTGLNSAITTAGGTALQGVYWSSTEIDDFYAWGVALYVSRYGDYTYWYDLKKMFNRGVRPCLAF